MGERVESQDFTREDRQLYRTKLKTSLDVLRQMLEQRWFEVERKLIGLELELNIADTRGCATMRNEELLAAIASDDYQTELAQFNIEVNLAPHKLIGTVFREIEEELRTSLNHAQRKAEELDSQIIMVGILPTLTDFHFSVENLTNNPRYALLNDQILEARGENLDINIAGVERLSSQTTSIAPEAATTSVQLHVQTSPEGFSRVWNAAQAICAVQVALGANSPFFLEKELWRETRIPLFEKATDTRTEELVAQGVRPR